MSEIFATLRKYEYNPDVMRLYVVGGGGCLVRNFGEYDRKASIVGKTGVYRSAQDAKTGRNRRLARKLFV